MKLPTAKLVKLLRGAAAAIEAGDSFEGHVIYSCLQSHVAESEFEVGASIRTGNSEGQGGIIHIESDLFE